MNNDTMNTIHTSLKKNKPWKKNLKDNLDQAKKSIEAKKSERPTGTLITTFHKHAGEANIYVRFVYSPPKHF